MFVVETRGGYLSLGPARLRPGALLIFEGLRQAREVAALCEGAVASVDLRRALRICFQAGIGAYLVREDGVYELLRGDALAALLSGGSEYMGALDEEVAREISELIGL